MWCDTVQFVVKLYSVLLRLFAVRVVVLCGVTPCNLLWSYIWPSYDIPLCGWLSYMVWPRAIWYEDTFGFVTTFHCAGGCLTWCVPCNLLWKHIWLSYEISLCGWLSYVMLHRAICCEVTFGLLTTVHCADVSLMWCDTVQFGVKIHLAFLRQLTVRVVVLCGVTPCILCEDTFGILTIFHWACGCLMWCDTVQFCVKLHLGFWRYFTVRVVFLCGVTPCKFVRRYIWPSYEFSLFGWLS
jgi:hypothetical protein